MGILAARLAADETRGRADWLNDDDELFDGPLSPSGVRVNARAAFSLPTFWRCVDLLASAVAQSPKDIVVKVGGRSFPEYGARPDWLITPNPTDETYTINDHFSQVALSVLVEGNAFVSVYPYVGDPRVLTVLNPLRVTVRPGPVYELTDETGRVTSTLGSGEVLHIAWLRPPGQLRGLSPVATLNRTIGAAIAAEEFAGRFFGQGAALSFGVEVPGQLDKERKDELRDQLKRRHAGLGQSHAIGVLTGGAKFVTGLAPTPEQAQMLETRKYAVEETCRPFGVPPGMVGSQEPGASSYASSERFDRQFKERAVLPFAKRIEAQYDRLLRVPSSITDPGASIQFRFNLDWIARADLLARYQAHAEGVTKGFLRPNEARALEDLAPVPGGDRLYMQAQMVPIDQLTSPAPAARSAEDS